MPDQYVRYSPDIEQIASDEAEVADRIIAVMSKGGDAVAKREGKAHRTSHAKAHALAVGELRVLDGLPPELRQGLFAEAKSYRVFVRLSHVPGEPLDDRRVSTPRGMSLKVLGVDGPTRHGEPTQDWVLDTGDVFIAGSAKTFLAEITATEAAMPLPTAVKAAVSAVSKGTNAALNAVGLNSAVLDFYGHPRLNPLTEAYCSQVPIRYGEYVAKLRVRPLGHDRDEPIEVNGENGLRDLVTAALKRGGAEFAVEIQLCTDLDRMPVEDAGARWSERESPYREVARLSLPSQDADPAGPRQADEDGLAFSPAHTLEAHRPLGSIMRARMRVYEVMAARRRQANGVTRREPTRAEVAPA